MKHKLYGSSLFALWLSVAVVALDQLSKWLVQQHLLPNQAEVVFAWLNLTLRYNQGAAFSFLANQSQLHTIFLLGFPVIIVLALLTSLLFLPPKQHWQRYSIALIIGGAVGNWWDRIRYGRVTDFIDFHIRHWHFATFNVADSAICIGAILFILSHFIRQKDTG